MMKRSLSELLLIRKDTELATRGAEVLEKMENALTKDLLSLERTIADLQKECSSKMDIIRNDLEEARKNSTLVDIEEMIKSEPFENSITIGNKKKFGKLVSIMNKVAIRPLEPRWGASFAYERARNESKALLVSLVDLGNAQSEREFVLSELSKTRRRVNALRQIIVPDLEFRKKVLEEWLDEENREELGRRNWVEGR